MTGIWSFLAVLVVFTVMADSKKVSVRKKDYCSICSDHTLCKYRGLGSACGRSGSGGVTKEQKKQIVSIHNKYRAQVARGQVPRHPPASNMMKMVWSDELARIAQTWADQCNFGHDSCRNTGRFQVGQNVYWLGDSNSVGTWKAAIHSWFKEHSIMDPGTVNSYQFSSATGHYTQLVWHDTYTVGCGRRSYGGSNSLYVCNYGPTGNWMGRPIYRVGKPCSACPGNTSCQGSLCARKN